MKRLSGRAGALLLILSTVAVAGRAEARFSFVRANTVEEVSFRPEVTLHTPTTHMDEGVRVHVVEPDEAKALFKELATLPGVPYNYPDEGCYARAHAMALALEKRGLVSAKAFVMGNLSIEAGGRVIHWRYHVAPVLAVSEGVPNFHLEVFDPSLFNHPVPIEEWVYEQTKATGSPFQVYYTTEYTYAPYAHEDHSLYLVMEHAWDAEELQAKDVALQTYSRLARQRQTAKENPPAMLWYLPPLDSTFNGWPEVPK